MKAFLLLIHCIAFTLSAQAWAVSDSQSCETRSQQLRGAAKENFLSSCLSQTLVQTSSPERVKAATAQEKRNTCEQNAKNMKMEGNRKAGYINDCMNANVAANEAKKAGVSEHVAAKQVRAEVKAAPTKARVKQTKPTKKSASSKHVDSKPKASLKTCSRQANHEKLKGEARKKFIRDCRKG